MRNPVLIPASFIVSSLSSTNAINAYNETTGRFTCPVAGTYIIQFNFNVCNDPSYGTYPNSNAGGLAFVVLNGTSVLASLSYGNYTSQISGVRVNGGIQGMVILFLTVGDIITFGLDTGNMTMLVCNSRAQIWKIA